VKVLAARTETLVASLALGGIMVLPLAEIVARKFFSHAIPGSGAYAANLTLWLGMLGAAIAARDGKLLTLATGEFLPKGIIASVAHVMAGAFGACVATLLTVGGIALVKSDREVGDLIAGSVPIWVADLAIPIGFGLIAFRLVWKASPHWWGRALAALGIVAGLLLNQHRELIADTTLWPWMLLVVIAGVLGAPIFAVLGGFAMFANLVRGRRGSAGRRAAPRSRPPRCARSLRCSRADPESRSSCSAVCCCPRSSPSATASASRSACSRRPGHSACSSHCRCR
jgi:TRAP-type C4-dicarboxylate transport system permease small subunit